MSDYIAHIRAVGPKEVRRVVAAPVDITAYVEEINAILTNTAWVEGELESGRAWLPVGMPTDAALRAIRDHFGRAGWHVSSAIPSVSRPLLKGLVFWRQAEES